MSRFQAFVDLGMSATKAAFNDGISFTSYLCPSKVADLPPSELTILKDQGDQLGSGIESGAYLQLGEQAFALADDAEGRPNKSTEMLRKSTLAKLRVLGAVGELAHRYSIYDLDMDIGIALPFDEYISEQHEISRQLKSVGTFVYRGQSIKLTINHLKILPEGAGLVQWRKMQAMQQGQPANKSYVVVIVGHRDLTFLIFRQGKPPTGEPSGTVRMGYLEFLQSVSQGICKADNPYLFEALLQGREAVAFPDQPGRTYELVERSQRSETFYWEQVKHHLSEKFAYLDIPNYEILVGGGTAHTLLKVRLDELLDPLPGGNMLSEIANADTRTHYVRQCAELFSHGDARLMPLMAENLMVQVRR
ncbi:MAG: ParM/StbA family protein, partial [Leptolyngbya sp. SIO1D8]|nr:ParM/StbA family protein [Leptolyngbya sp. SIO1D8]